MDKARRMQFADRVARSIFFACALLLIVVISSIFIFIGSNAFRVFIEGASLHGFFFTTNWDPTGSGDINGNPSYGAGGLILGSIVITCLAVIITVPLAFGLALCFTEVVPRWLVNLIQPVIEIFTGIPSVVIGFLGLTVLVPFLQKITAPITGGIPTGGYGWGAAILVLVVMILPTVASVSIDALRAVSGSVREASLALGATTWQTIAKAILPAAGPGLATAVVLGMARAIGETLAVSMVLSGSSIPNKLFTPTVFFQPNVNITQAIVNDFQETAGPSRDAYWTLAFVLLCLSFLFICVSRYLAGKRVYQ